MDRACRTVQIAAPARLPAPTAEGPPRSSEPADFVRLAQQEDPTAFGALYEEYAPGIARFLGRKLAGRDEEVEDLTAEVFVKAYQKLGQYQARGRPFSAWLYRIARNHLIDHLRALPRRAACSLDEGAEVPELAAGRALDRALDQQVLGPALAGLTAQQRRAVELRFLEGLSIAETAALMGCSEDAVKKLQSRGLVSLRRLLELASPSLPLAPAAIRVVASVA